MKRTLSIILIFIALTNIVGFMPLYFSLLQEIKGEVALKIAQGADLQKLLITDNEYNDPAVFSMTDENEFSFKGQMYDFKEVKNTAGGHTFYALQDNKEEGLIDFLKNTFGQSNDNSKNCKGPLGNLLKNFSKDFTGSFSTPVVPAIAKAVCYFIPVTNPVCTGYLNQLQPPPPDTVC